MRLSHMICLATAGMFFSSAAMADDLYYVELGSAQSQEQASTQWEELAKTHKDQLAGLQYYPSVIYGAKRSVSIRIQAGPIESKEDAQKLCAELFKKDAQCFVIEGMEAPEKVAARRAAEAPKVEAPLPWQAEAPVQVPQSAQKEEPGFFGRMFGDEEPEQASAIEIKETADLTPKEAKVEVAEAIPVPMSDVTMKTKPVFQESPAPMLESPKPIPAPAGDVRIETVGWLNVDKFDSENIASEFWQNVRGRAPQLAAGLRVRISKPLMARSEKNITLNIGPFGSQADADNFCEQGIMPIDPTLRCRFTQNEVRRSFAPMQGRSHGDDYNARRKQVMEDARAERMASGERSRPLPVLKITSYWVQLVSSPSQDEALEAWEKIRTDHSDLLAGNPSRVTALLGKKLGYAMRVGPFETQEEADKLCDNLQARDVACKIFSNK